MEENRKYIKTNITKEYLGKTLYKIQATKDFNNVKKGHLGGWIESEKNLSPLGNCWLYDNAIAMDYARVEDDATMYNNSIIVGQGRLLHNARLISNEKVMGNGVLYSNCDKFIIIDDYNISTVTCILKGGEVLYNVGCQKQITKEKFLDRIYNHDGGLRKNLHREEYLAIIKVADEILKEDNFSTTSIFLETNYDSKILDFESYIKEKIFMKK